MEALVIGGLQGVAELFPVSSLGHSILIPAVVGGSWAQDLDVSAPESPYLAFVVGLHVATALALIVYFRRDWWRIVRGLATSVGRREVVDADQRLGWLLVLATIPVGLAGLLLEHVFRVYLSKPVPTAAFLVLNGVLLLVADRWRRRAADEAPPASSRVLVEPSVAADHRLALLPVRRAVVVGTAQIAALAPGISRSGAAIAAGLAKVWVPETSHTPADLVLTSASVPRLKLVYGWRGAGCRLRSWSRRTGGSARSSR